MTGVVSVNLKKIKATKKVGRLLDENYRSEETAENYDDGKRIISVDKTKENVFLMKRPDDYDLERKKLLEDINAERKNRTTSSLFKSAAFKKHLRKDQLKRQTNRDISKTRKLRADTVDTLGIVVQPDANFINRLDRGKQVEFFKDALEVIKSNYSEFGEVKTAVIHFDENTPHMQVLSNTLNRETLTSDASKIVGNKSKLSGKQDFLADGLKAKGWDVKRGIKRVDNPYYQNFKSEAEAQGYKLSRFNDAKLINQFSTLSKHQRKNSEDEKRNKKQKQENQREKRRLEKKAIEIKSFETETRKGLEELATRYKKEVREKYQKRLKELEEQKKKLREDREAFDARNSDLKHREAVFKDKDVEATEKLKTAREILEKAKKEKAEALALKYQAKEERQKQEKHFEGVVKYVLSGELESDRVAEGLKGLTLSQAPDFFDTLKQEAEIKSHQQENFLDR